jgi:hypothetical protein
MTKHSFIDGKILLIGMHGVDMCMGLLKVFVRLLSKFCLKCLFFPAVNPAIMAAEETVGVVQGLTVELEVYVSGYPTPTNSQISWYDPDHNEISDAHTGVGFQDGGRRLILSDVQPHQAGSYECSVVISPDPYMGATTYIQLNVYGK